MRAAVLHKFKKALALEDVARPSVEVRDVLIQVEACGVCHSDLHVADGDWSQFTPITKIPFILGHEIAGRVVEKGAPFKSSRPATGSASLGFTGRAESVNFAVRETKIFAQDRRLLELLRTAVLRSL